MSVIAIRPSPTEAEAWAFERVPASVAEFEVLALRYADVAVRIRKASNDRNFPKLRAAYLDLAEIADQTAFLNDGLLSIIESTIRGSAKP